MRAVDPAEVALAARAQQAIIEIGSAQFDRAAAYTNVIVVAGYVGAFSIWAFVAPHLSKHATAAIAILLGASLLAFIGYEVYKMVSVARQFAPQAALLRQSLPAKKFLAELERLQLEEKKFSLTTLYTVWTVVLVICVGFAVAGIGLLFYNMAAILLEGPIWPG